MVATTYVFSPEDPRAPTTAQWEAMSPEERTRVVAQLPSESPALSPPEGDEHRLPSERASQALGEHFRRAGRRIYLSSGSKVYYPGEPWFAPDLYAVLDVADHPRSKWVVDAEGKGLDFVLEVTLAGNRKKDLEENVARYARLGVPEYFVLDLRRHRLLGYRLRSAGRTYSPIVPQGGRWSSSVLGLDLMLENRRIRFWSGAAPVLEASELIARLDTLLAEQVTREEELAAALEEAERRALSAEEKALSAEEKALSAEARAARLEELLRQRGVDPDGD